jgi:hypothetical protein
VRSAWKHDGTICELAPGHDKSKLNITSQEHTILLRPTVKEVVSRGDDY